MDTLKILYDNEPEDEYHCMVLHLGIDGNLWVDLEGYDRFTAFKIVSMMIEPEDIIKLRDFFNQLEI